jgi:hypothetical protein
VWALFFLLTALTWAQPFGAPKPIFPNDTQDPKQAGGAELLEAVCPGHVVVGRNIECKDICPESSAFKSSESPWFVGGITRGHLLSSTSDDAALDMGGCEAGNNNYGGTILLTRRSGKWVMMWYQAGVPTANCRRARLQSGRELLICMGEGGSAGFISTQLYVEDMTSPTRALRSGESSTFFVIEDNTFTCGENFNDESRPFRVKGGKIERVEFKTSTEGALRGLSVFGDNGERTMTPEQVKVCHQRFPSRDFWPATKPYRVDFKFDGKRMIRTGSSPGAPK